MLNLDLKLAIILISEAFLKSKSLECSWWSSPFNDYEYCAVETQGDWDSARLTCLDLGGMLAYKGFSSASTHTQIYENMTTQVTNLSMFWFGAFYVGAETTTIRGMDGEIFSSNNYRDTEPSANGQNCIMYCGSPGVEGEWCDAECDWVGSGAICQRPKGLF